LVAVADWQGGRPGEAVPPNDEAGVAVDVCPVELDAPPPQANEAKAQRTIKTISAHFMGISL